MNSNTLSSINVYGLTEQQNSTFSNQEFQISTQNNFELISKVDSTGNAHFKFSGGCSPRIKRDTTYFSYMQEKENGSQMGSYSLSQRKYTLYTDDPAPEAEDKAEPEIVDGIPVMVDSENNPPKKVSVPLEDMEDNSSYSTDEEIKEINKAIISEEEKALLLKSKETQILNEVKVVPQVQPSPSGERKKARNQLFKLFFQVISSKNPPKTEEELLGVLADKIDDRPGTVAYRLRTMTNSKVRDLIVSRFGLKNSRIFKSVTTVAKVETVISKKISKLKKTQPVQEVKKAKPSQPARFPKQTGQVRTITWNQELPRLMELIKTIMKGENPPTTRKAVCGIIAEKMNTTGYAIENQLRRITNPPGAAPDYPEYKKIIRKYIPTRPNS